MATLFEKLKNLVSGNVIVRKSADSKKLHVADVNNFQAFGNVQTNFMDYRGMNTMGGYHSTVGALRNAELSTFGIQRPMLFRDYELMEMDPIICAALDLIADECAVKDEFGDVLTIKTENEDIKKILDNLFVDIMNIDFNLWPWVRSMLKYGDFYLKLDIAEKYGVVNIYPLPVYEVIREEGFDPNEPSAIRFTLNGTSRNTSSYYEDYEVAHFRLLSDSNYLPYGKSAIEGVRRVWKQLCLLEDAAMIHRIMRAPEKRIFKIDTGNTPPKEWPQLMKSIADKMKRVPYLDPRSGDYNLKYNIQNITEDMYLPVTGGDSGTSVETLPGLQWDSIADIEYLQNKLLIGLKMPRAYLGYVVSEGAPTDGKSIAAQDVRFARTVERYQRCIVSELTKIAIIHLYSQGITDERLVDFELSLTMPSTIYEQEKIALWQEKINLARDAKEVKMFSNDWIYKNIFNFTETDIIAIQKQVVDDTKTMFRLSQIENEGNDPYKTFQTYGTPHDLVMLQKGKLTDTDDALKFGDNKTRGVGRDVESDDVVDFGDNNFRSNLTGNENITDEDDYDVEYNKNKRTDPRSKYGQDSHINGRDPLNKKMLRPANKVARVQNIRDSYDTSLAKSKEIIRESLMMDDIEDDIDIEYDPTDDMFLSEDNKQINE